MNCWNTLIDMVSQASVDLDAARLVVGERAENGDHGLDDGNNIPF